MNPSKITKSLVWGLTFAALVMAWAAPARADIIRWNLVNFEFLDGGVANGFFDWDTAALTSPNYDIALSGGNTLTFPAFSYTDETTDFLTSSGAQNVIFFFEPVSGRVFRIGVAALTDFNTPLPVLDLVPYALTGPAAFIECFNCSPARNGDTTAEAHLSSPTAVPEPASGWLLAGGFIAALGLRRRRAG